MRDRGGVGSAISMHSVAACPPAARISLLGGFGLHLHGERVELPHTAERLISFLALHPRALMRVFVAGSLWMNASESQACSSLRSLLWHVRARTPVIDATSTHLSLAPGVEVDVAECAAVVRRLHDSDEPPSRADVHALCEAGELLPDWYDDWVLIERERHRQLRLHAIEQLCVCLSAEGRHAAATEAGLVAVASEPLRESAHRVLIAAHLAEGNASEALRQYGVCCRLLRRDLELGPSPALERLIAPVRRP